MIDSVMPFLTLVKFLSINKWDSIGKIAMIKQPILYIRSLKDEIVPTNQMIKLIKNTKRSVYIK